MHKSPDEERVCGRCGGLLLNAAERRKVARAHSDESNTKQVNSENGAGPRSRTLQIDTARVAPKDESASAIAIREALEYLDSPPDRRATPDRRTPAERRAGDRRATEAGSKPSHKENRAWLIPLGVTLLVATGLAVFFSLHGGSSASGPGGTTAPSATPTTTTLFQFTGSGPSTTGPFTATAAFTFSYSVTCQENLAGPVMFQLLRAGRSIGQVASSSGGLRESGNEPSFGTSGTFTVSVSAPTSCTWMVSGQT
jgi:hypothetical protein